MTLDKHEMKALQNDHDYRVLRLALRYLLAGVVVVASALWSCPEASLKERRHYREQGYQKGKAECLKAIADREVTHE